MKKITSICAVVIAFISLTAMGMLAAEFKFDKETHDFGKIALNKPVSHEYKFSNSGDEPIIISDVQPTCGCSVAEFTKTPVKPGEAGTIKVTFNAAAKGPFTKSFIVKSNTKTPVKTLTIKGIVE
ncbi:DUF1573 domain-containing protein [Sphingobacterium daejeonense]|jgi:hypothetical protein|uniref:DUF1573 domain-containing protein n=1 Tax=Sphingobacterium daejeonense TaxID=371142 RepID=A0ABW3RJA8_9SPHI|nr:MULTISPECIES: DUF1573 domain-containing protein [Sphingobacterium]MCT1531455.1 DUF1573 domain-containing protein [Sphingobacterium daejeonense]VTP98939.1 Protein of uncharacterised function (DUF1573) [Sphingobacterium daejeonense]